MDAATVRSMLEQNFEYSGSDPERAHEMYHDDAVLEFPQVRRALRRGRELPRVEKRPVNFGISIHEFRGDKIARETIYVGEGWEPPKWRAQWRFAA